MNMWNESDIGDLSGKLYIVTGGNTGLGLATTHCLPGAGARVIFTARDPGRGHEALTRLQAEAGSRVQLRELDLGSLKSIAQFTKRLLSEESRVDSLVLNAGVALLPYGKTVDGFETHFAVNHPGHFALTLPLIPIITSVVVTSSEAANEAAEPLPFEKLALREQGINYDAMQAYAVIGNSKVPPLV